MRGTWYGCIIVDDEVQVNEIDQATGSNVKTFVIPVIQHYAILTWNESIGYPISKNYICQLQ